MSDGERTAPSAGRPPRLRRWWADVASLAWLAVLFFGLCRWSWRKWADLYIDFGRELYQPWQMTRGKVLYRDLYLDYGPLSKHVNAALFDGFGASFQTLFTSNLVILAGFTVLLHRLIAEIVGRWSAVAAASVFLLVFAFSQYVGIANYNFVAPYSHEATHGLVLSFVLLYCLWRCLPRFHSGWLAAAGLAFGAVLLTKPELGVAAAGAVGVCAVSMLFTRAVSGRARWRGLAAFGAGAVALPFGFLLHFHRYMSGVEALKATGGAWTPLAYSSIGRRPFELWVMGTDAPGENIVRMLEQSLAYVVALGALLTLCWGFGRYEARGGRLRAGVVLAAGAAACAAVAYVALRIDWLNAFHPLPVTTACIAVLLGVFFAAGTGSGWMTRARLVILLSWAAYALLLLLKIVLNARIEQYGFYLAMPAALLLVVFTVGVLPAVLPTRAPLTRFVWQALMVAVLTGCIATALKASSEFYTAKRHSIGSGGDRIVTYAPESDQRTIPFEQMLDHCRKHLPRGATLTAMPEGLMVNYLLRRESPSPVVTFGPFAMGGESPLLDTLRRRPADYIMLIHRDQAEFGVGPFGADPRNGAQIMAWVWSEYEPVALMGAPPFVSQAWGIGLLRRRSIQELAR